ncbi:signal transduction histidine kinase [Saccharothrix tamanrassetensis]|uniref:histidine kinase n=1 Tax=Saccharothrix tamanrassetensis TaxID=1051531 RepID=A0A841CMP8_9PSEU|nr:CHASE3 domain-containing protein [Saccharothrix tamanrassetensis]MBB5957275.1 signal transduction histidine kinase [Saccharothrix tamanrassetensis]
MNRIAPWRRLTVQAWFGLLLGLMILLLVVGALAGAQALRRTAEVSDELVDRIQPAHTEALRLRHALVDQETGVRGYVLGADFRYLRPYEEGIRVEAQALARLREVLDGRDALLADVDAIDRTARQWRREYAEPAISAVVAGSPRPEETAAVLRGKETFDRLRGLFDEHNARLDRAREDGHADLDRARRLRDVVLGSTAAGLMAMGVAMAVVVHLVVIRPLRVLRVASRKVSTGEFGQRIEVRGAVDVRSVAEDVEQMRGRIVAALEASRANEQRLRRQTAELDAQTEELRRSNSELEQFAYVASHDLQEPLRKVASFCQLLDKRYGDQLDERAQQYIGFAVDGAKRMQVLINDLLTFSRVGRQVQLRHGVSLDSTLSLALDNLATRIEENRARIQRPAGLPTVDGDPTHLAMLWQNLVGNALKFRRPDRDPAVTITCDPDTLAGGRPAWRIGVADNGIGVDPQYAEKIFVIFQRLHGRDEYSGTGIGLAVCRKIVEYHGGTIRLDTDHRDGTRLVFTLPAHRLSEDQPDSPRG